MEKLFSWNPRSISLLQKTQPFASFCCDINVHRAAEISIKVDSELFKCGDAFHYMSRGQKRRQDDRTDGTKNNFCDGVTAVRFC